METAVAKKENKLALPSSITDIKYNEGLVHQLVTTYLSNARSGNSAQ